MNRWSSPRLRQVRHALSYAKRAYLYRCSVLGAHNVVEKTRILCQILLRFLIKRKSILFYPDNPERLFAIYKIVLFLGYRITADPSKRCDIAIKWRNALDGNPFLPPEPALANLTQTRPHLQLINMQCNDVSKRRVSAVFENTFGYSLSVDPQTYTGKCVMKSDWNGLHIGRIIDCPTLVRGEGFVYEKLIHNEVENGLVEDIRVPVFRSNIPFVYLKYRPVDDRLVDRARANEKAVIAEVADVLSAEEINKIKGFCRRMGLDYGEIDVLRDRQEQRIYIVDVNNNPAGPTQCLGEDGLRTAVMRLARAFEETFKS